MCLRVHFNDYKSRTSQQQAAQHDAWRRQRIFAASLKKILASHRHPAQTFVTKILCASRENTASTSNLRRAGRGAEGLQQASLNYIY